MMDLHSTAAVLHWDQETKMPPGGVRARAEQLATISSLAHEMFTSAELADGDRRLAAIRAVDDHAGA